MAPQDELDPANFPKYPPLDSTGHVDLSQIDCNLMLTPAQRTRQLEDLLEFARLAQAARIRQYGFDPAADALTEAAE